MIGKLALEDSPAESVVEIFNPAGTGNFVLVCEHASHVIPLEYGNLGLAESELREHFVWDPGAFALAQLIAEEIDAPLVAPKVSRLLYDCNRAPGMKSAVPDKVDGVVIKGNTGLSKDAIKEREIRYYRPFRETLQTCIRQQTERNKNIGVVTIHSFTPVFGGVRRELDLGVLHDKDQRIADIVLGLVDQEGGILAGRNAPYGPDDGVTHTLREHALSLGLPNLMLEVRNDLLADEHNREGWAIRISRWLTIAYGQLFSGGEIKPQHKDGGS